jgi:hypothetical protein
VPCVWLVSANCTALINCRTNEIVDGSDQVSPLSGRGLLELLHYRVTR